MRRESCCETLLLPKGKPFIAICGAFACARATGEKFASKGATKTNPHSPCIQTAFSTFICESENQQRSVSSFVFFLRAIDMKEKQAG